MAFQDLPIKRKVRSVIMLTSLIAMLLTVAAFMVYDLVSYRQTIVRNLSTSAAIIADNSTGALLYDDEETAQQILSALKADPHIVAAALYDMHGDLFVRYPTNQPSSEFPLKPPMAGVHFENRHVIVFEPSIQDQKRAGTVYLKSNLSALWGRLKLYGGIALLVMIGASFVAFLISNRLQRRITDPILELANAAKIVSEQGDFALRARKTSNDELGLLTDAFNSMITRIQEKTLALKESEERLRLAVEASRSGTWDWNLKTNKVNWDDLNHALFGVRPGAFSGSYEDFLLLIHADDRANVISAIARALDKKEPYFSEFRVLWPDQSIHHLVARGEALFSESGEPVRMIGVTVDISERKQAEQVRSFLAAIVDSSDDAVIGKDLESRVVSWNDGAARMFGYAAAEMIGQPITRIVSPEAADEEPRIVKEVQQGQIRHYETVRIRKDGKPIEVSLSISPIRDGQNRIIGISSIARDITDRKQTEQALERNAAVLREQAQLLDLANVLARDLDDRIILWNTGMEKMYGWTKAEALGRISHELLQTTFPEAPEAIRARLFQQGHWEGELSHVRKDGVHLVVASQWVLHGDIEGRPRAILEINNDVTQRKQAEQQILRMNMELEQHVQERTAELTAANQEMEAFTYSVAHDLRAPLRHIDAFTRILQEDLAGDLPPEAQRYLENIRNGSRNMSRLVDDLLNLARVGRQELRRQPVTLAAVIQEVIEDLKNDTSGRSIEWRIQPLPVIEGDPGLLKQVFANLLANAVKYTRPRQNAVIEIGTSNIDGRTAVFVRDNGVGFNMKYADKLFGVFQRLHRAEDFEGTGVGLATVERIIRKHGGKVWAEAAVDKGATFFFTLPGLEAAKA